MYIFFSRRDILKLITTLPFVSFYGETRADYMPSNIRAIKFASGGGERKVIINSIEELEHNLSGSEAKTLVINRHLKSQKKNILFLGSNKTLMGVHPGIVLNNIYLEAYDNTGNIIIKDLIFLHDRKINANNDIQLRVSKGDRYYINNCKFMGHEWSLDEGAEDKLIYFGDDADNIVISNCVFANHRYGCIFGHPEDGKAQYIGKPTAFIYNNHYINIYVRAPGLFRYGVFLVYNNHIKEFHLGFTLDGHAKVYSYNNFFNTKQRYYSVLDYKNGFFLSKGDMVNGVKYFKEVDDTSN